MEFRARQGWGSGKCCLPHGLALEGDKVQCESGCCAIVSGPHLEAVYTGEPIREVMQNTGKFTNWLNAQD